MSPLKCRICDGNEKVGINLLGVHICKECIDDITRTNIEDMKYEFYKSVIKKTWIDYIISTD